MANEFVVMSEEQLQDIVERVEKLKGWLKYSEILCETLRQENEKLRKQIFSDQESQILKITEEKRAVLMYRV